MDQIHQAIAIAFWQADIFTPEHFCQVIHSINPDCRTAVWPTFIYDWVTCFDGCFSKDLPYFQQAHVIRCTKNGIITKFHSTEKEWSTWRPNDASAITEPFQLLTTMPKQFVAPLYPQKLSKDTINDLRKAKQWIPEVHHQFYDELAQETNSNEPVPVGFHLPPPLKLYEKVAEKPIEQLPVDEETDLEFQVKAILGHRTSRQKTLFKVKWYNGEETEEPASNLYSTDENGRIIFNHEFKKYVNAHHLDLEQLTNTSSAKRKATPLKPKRPSKKSK